VPPEPVVPPPVLLLVVLAPVAAVLDGPPPEPVAVVVVDGPPPVALPPVPLDVNIRGVDWQPPAKTKKRRGRAHEAPARSREEAMRQLQRLRAGFATRQSDP
jgi:hypothetical protein